MAELAGYGGQIRAYYSDATTYLNMTSDTTNINAWNLDMTADALDVTTFVDSGNHTFVRGLKGWTATAEGFVDDTYVFEPSDVGTTVALYLHVDHSNLKYYTGNAILTGISPSVSVDSVETASLSFQGTGTLTYSDVA